MIVALLSMARLAGMRPGAQCVHLLRELVGKEIEDVFVNNQSIMGIEARQVISTSGCNVKASRAALRGTCGSLPLR